MKLLLAFFAISALFCGHALAANGRPNVLFIALDDLNDWIGCLGGHPQTKTPNLDRLAASGVLFRNAYTAAASCNPSRSAIFSGLPPHRSGLYHNLQKIREVMPQAELLPRYFSKQGYWSAGSGKMLHYVIDPPSWDDYFPAKAKDNPFPHTFYPEKRPVNLPRAGDWQYVETDWAALDATDEQWKKGIQAYLASIHFADAMLGRVLDALEKSPQRDNTIVVLWSDHGWHLGEKEHWQKFTGWRVCGRVPLMIRVPKGAPGLPEGTAPGSVCDRPVSLVDLFGTLTDLCGLPPKADIASRSLVPLLRDPQTEWPHAAVTHLDRPQNYAISTQRWRCIHYTGDEEELYDIETDPHEWTNLATKPEHAAKLAEMRLLAPKQIVPVHPSPAKCETQ